MSRLLQSFQEPSSAWTGSQTTEAVSKVNYLKFLADTLTHADERNQRTFHDTDPDIQELLSYLNACISVASADGNSDSIADSAGERQEPETLELEQEPEQNQQEQSNTIPATGEIYRNSAYSGTSATLTLN